MARITLDQLMTFTGNTSEGKRHAKFIAEYIKDFNTMRAGGMFGIHPNDASALLDNPNIQLAIDWALNQRYTGSIDHITAEWVLWEAVDNHMLARQQGKISQSNKALDLIAKHAKVDAFAAEKVQIQGDEEVMARLLRARKRAAEMNQPEQPKTQPNLEDITPPDEEISFL